MKKLGFGLMRLPLTDPNSAASIDIKRSMALTDLFLARGYTYFDTAWLYHGHASENAVKELLTDRYPRDAFTLATKLHIGFVKTKEDRDRIFEEQRRKTGLAFFDYYLLHGIDDGSYPKYEEMDCFQWMQEKKAQGLVKKIGFSYHAGPELLERILSSHPETEFVQLQINYLDWENDAIGSRGCYEVATRHQVPVTVMEPVKGGTLAALPQKAEARLRALHPDWSPAYWAIRFAAGLPNVGMVLSGMNDPAQVEENICAAEAEAPLNEAELTALHQAVALMNDDRAVACTGCAYCVAGCPKHIAIPQYFTLYNADLQEAKTKSWHPQRTYYANLTHAFGKASECVACGQCEQACPQHLPIARLLREVAARLEA